MAITRLNPTAAMTQLRQAGAELRRAVLEAGALASAPKLALEIQAFEQDCAGPVRILARADDGTTPREIATWLLGDTACTWDADGVRASAAVGQKAVEILIESAHLPSHEAALRPPVLAMRPREGAAQPPPDVAAYPCVLTTRPMEGVAGQVIVEPEATNVLARLFGSGSGAQTLELLHADVALAALERLVSIAGLAFDQELRGLRARRALGQARMTAVQAGPAVPAPNEISASVKNLVQRTFSEFARGLEERFSVAVSSPTAAFWPSLDRELESITALDEEPRLKTITLKLRADDEARWLAVVRDVVARHCAADARAVSDMLRSTAEQIERQVAAAGGPPVVIQIQPITDARISRVIDNALVPQRKYQSEAPKQGFFQYLMMARRYQTVALMLMSAFGLSFVRSYREFMLPLAIVLLSFGALQVVHSARRDRVESLQRELEKVRELLRTETRRMASEVERGWTAAVGQHLADQAPAVVAQVDNAVRDAASRTVSDGADERQRLQRQLQGFDAAERKLNLPQKTREGLAQGVAQLRGELRPLVAAGLRGAGA